MSEEAGGPVGVLQGEPVLGGPVLGGPVGVVPLDGLCPVDLLAVAVSRLVAQDPVALDGPVALARAAELLVARERLQGAVLTAVRDVDRRELFTLASAGSTRGWLRTQLGGDSGQLMLARRLADRPLVAQALTGGSVSGRAAGQLCTALDDVPDQVPEPAITAVLTDGLSALLAPHTAAHALDDVPITPAAAAVRTDLAQVSAACLAATGQPPAVRLEPALLLLARHLPPGGLGAALDLLLDALQPDRIDPPRDDEFYLHLTPMLGGAWDLRGHLDPETGTLLAREIERRDTPAAAPPDDGLLDLLAGAAHQHSDTDHDQHDPDRDPDRDRDRDGSGPFGGTDPVRRNADRDPDGDSGHNPRTPDPHASTTPRTLPAGQRRHDALRQLLHDLTDPDTDPGRARRPGSGRPPPVALTIHTTLDALEARPGALPGTLTTPRGPVSLTASTLRRLGCHSQLTAVLLDAYGRPLAASGTHRSATRRERAALHAQWGPQCAVAGCSTTQTVPHHVRPWWLTHQTALRDLIPICQHDHRDLHETQRTLRLKDGRHIDELGWVGREGAR